MKDLEKKPTEYEERES